MLRPPVESTQYLSGEPRQNKTGLGYAVVGRTEAAARAEAVLTIAGVDGALQVVPRRSAILADLDSPRVLVAKQNPERRHVLQRAHVPLVLLAGFPSEERRREHWMGGRGFELESVPRFVEIGELIGVHSLHDAGPRVHRLLEPAP